MKLPRVLRHSLLAASLILAAPVSTPVHAAPAPAVETTPTSRFTLEVRNGQIIENGKGLGPATVGSIMEYLKKQNHDFSLALGPGVASIAVGDMILQMDSFDIESICSAIVNCTNEPLHAGMNVGVASLSVIPQSRQVAVFNLSTYLNPDGKADEKTISAKLNTLTEIILRTKRDATQSDKDDPTFQFHGGANLLVVTGNKTAIDIATKVVNALTRSASHTAAPGGFVPADATNPDPAQWLYTPSYSYSAVSNPDGSTLAALNRAQQALSALQRLAAQQNALGSDKAKTLQQQIDDTKKLLQELQQQIKNPPTTP